MVGAASFCSGVTTMLDVLLYAVLEDLEIIFGKITDMPAETVGDRGAQLHHADVDLKIRFIFARQSGKRGHQQN